MDPEPLILYFPTKDRFVPGNNDEYVFVALLCHRIGIYK